MYPGVATLCPEKDPSHSDYKKCDGTGVFFQVFLIEVIVTFIFVGVCLNIKYHVGAQSLGINALAVASTLVACILASVEISGGCINPVVGVV